MVRLGNWHVSILKSRGQSTVEYILLLAVVISIIYLLVNSQRFKDLLGEGGTLATRMKGTTEWNYRFASPGNEEFAQINYPNGRHPTYWNGATNTTHFIGPKKPYPAP